MRMNGREEKWELKVEERRRKEMGVKEREVDWR